MVAERGEEAGLEEKKEEQRQEESGGNATQLADHSPPAGGGGARRLRWPLPCRLQKTEGRSGSGLRTGAMLPEDWRSARAGVF